MHHFVFYTIRPEEVEQAVAIEQICFPPHEVCTPEAMRERIAAAADFFLVAADEDTGRIAGFLNGLATRETAFHDGFFRDTSLHDPEGDAVMLLGLDVLPEYRRQGLATAIVSRYAAREREKGRKRLHLTCLDEKVAMYKKMGFTDRGMANSSWGGEPWHEMVMDL